MPYPLRVKEIAYKLDPECWISYSGLPVEIKRARDARRNAALAIASHFQPKESPMSNDPFADFLSHALGVPVFTGPADNHGLCEIIVDIDLPEPKRYHSTVMKIGMMLHFATTAGPYQPEAQRTSPAYTKFIKQLLRDGLVERPTKSERAAYPGWAYKATDKGRAYVEALKDVQLPVATTTWSFPE